MNSSLAAVTIYLFTQNFGYSDKISHNFGTDRCRRKKLSVLLENILGYVSIKFQVNFLKGMDFIANFQVAYFFLAYPLDFILFALIH